MPSTGTTADDFTDEQKKDYLDCGGLCCPFCGSERTECWGEFMTGENGLGWQKMECDTCLETWKEVYRLETIEPL